MDVCSVLLVDDEVDFVSTLTKRMKKRRVKVSSVNCGEDAHYQRQLKRALFLHKGDIGKYNLRQFFCKQHVVGRKCYCKMATI